MEYNYSFSYLLPDGHKYLEFETAKLLVNIIGVFAKKLKKDLNGNDSETIIHKSIEEFLEGFIYQNVIDAYKRALKKYKKSQNTKDSRSISSQSGLNFSTKITQISFPFLSVQNLIFITAVFESLIYNILYLSLNKAKESNSDYVKKSDIYEVLKEDKTLSPIFENLLEEITFNLEKNKKYDVISDESVKSNTENILNLLELTISEKKPKLKFKLHILFNGKKTTYKIYPFFLEKFDYFKNLIVFGKGKDECTIEVFHEKNGEDILTFLFSNFLDINIDDIEENDFERFETLLEIADMYQLENLVKLCKLALGINY